MRERFEIEGGELDDRDVIVLVIIVVRGAEADGVPRPSRDAPEPQDLEAVLASTEQLRRSGRLLS